ncbi:MAG: hypothetical protein ABIP51_20385 [Bacteroidia bacterium]
MLKTLLSATLLLTISIVAFRFLFFISYIQSQKSDFRKQLIFDETKQVVELTFSSEDIFIDKNGFEWKENNNELVINGAYYEVISVVMGKNEVVVKIIADEAEDDLFQHYFCLNKESKNGYLELIKLLLNFTYIHNDHSSFSIPNIATIRSTIHSKVQFLDQHYFLKQIKPPQFA